MKNYSFLLLLLFSHACISDMIISVVQVPGEPNGEFSTTVVAGPTNDDVNPCFRRDDNCNIRFYTIDESWYPAGRMGYKTLDQRGYQFPKRANQYATLSLWWGAVTDKNRIGRDRLPIEDGDRPCVVLAAGDQWTGMILNTIVSNCAKGIVQAKTCDLKPKNINVDLHVALGGTAPTVNVNNVTLTCTADASVLIETNTAERVPLGGSADSYALLDWGAGFGKPRTVKARRNVAEELPLRVRGVGLDLLGAGQFTGSAIVNVSYN